MDIHKIDPRYLKTCSIKRKMRGWGDTLRSYDIKVTALVDDVKVTFSRHRYLAIEVPVVERTVYLVII
jgi:histidyl-tRNA synthetase